ncbi:MAG: zeta toxin family protein [Candidatus Peribacteria bacterium]|jgi:hypothetical protein|nr:zeta toxin family protein [Candidatus Peribacteria bacterium]
MIEGDFKKRNESFVIVNPDEVKRFLPEYDKGSGVVDGGIVHEESSYLSKIIYNKAIEG